MKKIFTLIAVIALACSSAFAMKAVKLESTGQWAEFGLSDQVPFGFDKYVGYKVMVGEMNGTFQINMGSVETTPTEVSWSDTPLDISNHIIYNPLVAGENVFADFEAPMAENGCTQGIRSFNVQCCDEGSGSTIEILEVILITPDGEEVIQELGASGWGYNVTEIETGDEPGDEPGDGETVVVWEGEYVMDWWNDVTVIPTSYFPLLTEGATIAFTFSAVDAEAEDPCFKAQTINADWSQTWLPSLANCPGAQVAEATDDNPAGDIHVPVKEPGTITTTINAADVEVINAAGVQKIMVVGQGLTISEIAITPAGAGIAGVEVAPVQDNRIFNIWGVQVDENYRGIVISNGKKYIQR